MTSRTQTLVAASLLLAAFPAGARAQAFDQKTPAPASGPKPAASLAAQAHKPAASLQAAKPSLSERLAGIGGRPAIESVLHDRNAQGTEFARGVGWKASFDASGATFVPFLGSSAPQNHPLRFSLESIRSGGTELELGALEGAGRDGELVTLAHGEVLERYELGLHGIEQSFVIPTLPQRGELVLRLGVASDLQPSLSADGAEFSCELGGVRYGNATALDAAGNSVGATLELDGAALVIRVPEEFVATAELPLVIDPLLTGFTVQSGTDDDFHPDIAGIDSLDRYAIVWEEAFSAADHDVYAASYYATGAYVMGSQVTIDSSSTYVGQPRIASYVASSTFLIVAAEGQPAAGARQIVARVLGAPSNTLGPVLVVNGVEPGDKFGPDVCGDWRPGGGYNYCVVWERDYGAGDHDIQAQWLTPTTGGKVFPNTIAVDNSSSTLDQHPALPKTCGTNGVISIVWERQASSNDRDLFCARYGLSGLLFTGSTALDLSLTDMRYPSATASLDGSDRWALAYQQPVAGDLDVMVRLMDGTSEFDTVNLGELESAAGSSAWTEDQTRVMASTDGDDFIFAYSETYNGLPSDHDVYVATLGQVAGQLRLCEGHLALGLSFTLEDEPRTCSLRDAGGVKGRFLTVWQDTGDPTNHGEIMGATFLDQPLALFCMPGADAATCPCGNPPSGWGRGCDNSSSTGGAWLSSTGSPSIGADTLQFQSHDERPTATSVFLSGTSVTDTVFGQGRRCVGGTLKRLYVKTASGGNASAPVGGDVSVHARSAALGDPLAAGTVRYYLVYYRDPVVLGGCSAASTFNSTPTGALTWRP